MAETTPTMVYKIKMGVGFYHAFIATDGATVTAATPAMKWAIDKDIEFVTDWLADKCMRFEVWTGKLPPNLKGLPSDTEIANKTKS